MDSNSRIFFTNTTGTQTDLTNYSYMPAPMVLIPFEHYRAMATMFFTGSNQPVPSSSSNAPVLEENISACKNTTMEKKDDVNDNDNDIEVIFENIVSTAASVDVSKQKQDNIIATSNEKTMLNDTSDIYDSEEPLNKSVISSKTNEKNKNYGKPLYSYCYVKLKRLNVNDLNSLNCALDQIRKIPFKKYMDSKKTLAKSHETQSISTKRPILTSYLTSKTKVESTADSVRSNSSFKSNNNYHSVKRSSNDYAQNPKRKQIPSKTSKNLFMAMAREIESLANVDPQLEDISDDDDNDLENWCLTKAIRVMENYKSKDLHKKGHSDHKK